MTWSQWGCRYQWEVELEMTFHFLSCPSKGVLYIHVPQVNMLTDQYWPPCSVLDFHMTWYHGNRMFRSNVMCKLSKCSTCLTFPMRPLPTGLANNQLVVSRLPFISVHMHFWRYQFSNFNTTHTVLKPQHIAPSSGPLTENCQWWVISVFTYSLCWYSFRGSPEWGE